MVAGTVGEGLLGGGGRRGPDTVLVKCCSILRVRQYFVCVIHLTVDEPWIRWESDSEVHTLRNMSSEVDFSAAEAPWGRRSGWVSKAFFL